MSTEYVINISTVEQLCASQKAHILSKNTYNNNMYEHLNNVKDKDRIENESGIINNIYKFIKYYALTLINYNTDDSDNDDDTYTKYA